MATWIDAGTRCDLMPKSRRVLKAGAKQILLIADGDKLFAVNNRCGNCRAGLRSTDRNS